MENMTIEEIAEYLEDNNYPMNDINNVSTNTCTIYTGKKGGYLLQASIIQMVRKELAFLNTTNEPITKEYLDIVIKAKKSYPSQKGLL